MNKKTQNLIFLIISFCGSWVLGEVFKSEYSQNLTTSMCVLVAVFIALGIHQDIAKKIKRIKNGK